MRVIDDSDIDLSKSAGCALDHLCESMIPKLSCLPIKFNDWYQWQNVRSQIGSRYHKTGTYLLHIK